MTTPFSDIYTIFLSQLTDYNLNNMDDAALESNMQGWLTSAVGYFTNCKKNITDYDLDVAEFNVDLSQIEKQILAKYMLYVYVDTYLITESNLKQTLNSRDYRAYSPAGQIKALIELKKQINNDATVLVSRYSYNIHDLEGKWKNE
ncbi:hypothetical protein [Siminovitchia sp. 179-K 8D1 HS]|uniref:hypothetical protein n=1 Tax=Siminovitchia sp. 179-K 8D1 HS TaxID=3142385 RepID=UPI0039A20D68